jgi:glucose/arabinose dehydrogenase
MAAMLAIAFGSAAANAQPFAVGGDARVDPGDFQVTTFADGLDFPVGLAVLQDGSLLVGVNTPPPGGSYFSASGALLRLVDANSDGIADDAGNLLYTGLPGFTTAVRVAGELVFVASGSCVISVLRQGATPASPLALEGSLSLAFPLGWSHTVSNLSVRESPGQPGRFEVYFNIGAKANEVGTQESIPISGLVTANASADSLYRVTIDDTGPSLGASGLEQIASGLRNAFGTAFQPSTGDLYLQDNGIDGLSNPNEPLSADELNRIPAASIGGAVEDFGFPERYVAYRTGTLVGSGGIDPIIAFQPVPPPNGSESEGAADVVFAPPGFPVGLREGIFVGFHGRFSQAGLANEENPLVYVDLATSEHFHFIGNDEPDIGHPDTLAVSEDSIFVADLSNATGLSTPDSGAIYRIRALPSAAPALPFSGLALLVGLLMLAGSGAVSGHARFLARLS